jgi:hypothetical protein
MNKPTILYRGHQWRVTRRYLETHDGRYSIEKDRLLETTERQDGTFYDFPIHMAGKREWVDVEDLLCAFRRALEIHALQYDREMLDRTIAKARIWIYG